MEKFQQWVFEDNRVVVADDTVNILYTDELSCTDEVVRKVVEIHNLNPDNGLHNIDQYLLNEPHCTQENREEIVEKVYAYYAAIAAKRY